MRSSSWKRWVISGLALLGAFNLGLFARPVIDELRRPDAFTLLEQAEGISQPGMKGAPKVFVAFDPYCSYCHKLYKALVARVEAGEVQVEWLPVAFMQTDSLNVASEMLSSADPAVSLSRWFGAEVGTSPVIPKGGNPAAREKVVATNTALVRTLVGKNAAPAVFYRDAAGQVQVAVGVPADLDAWVKGLRSNG